MSDEKAKRLPEYVPDLVATVERLASSSWRPKPLTTEEVRVIKHGGGGYASEFVPRLVATIEELAQDLAVSESRALVPAAIPAAMLGEVQRLVKADPALWQSDVGAFVQHAVREAVWKARRGEP